MRSLHSYLIGLTSLLAISAVFYFLYTQLAGKELSFHISDSFLQLNTIFLSILIEAIPFVLIGVLIAGFIQIFVTEDHIRRLIPKNRFLAVMMSCIVGALFPACECGIVPIVRRLIEKGVPLHAGIGFLLTGPLINPIVIFSTYMAFGNDMEMAGLRMGIGFAAALLISFIISFLFKSNQLKHTISDFSPATPKRIRKEPLIIRIVEMLHHSIDEFFDMGKYLIVGAFIAAAVQTYVSAKSLFLFGDSVLGFSVVMMGLAYFLSLCSEADAFIGASFRNLVPTSAILSFLVYGPMIDLKNTIMLLSVFKARFVFILFMLITFIVLISTSVVSFI